MNLAEALQNQFKNSSLPAQITGGLWIAEVAPGTAYPYATFRPIGGPMDYQFTNKIMENAAFSFSTYAAGADASLNLAAALLDGAHVALDAINRARHRLRPREEGQRTHKRRLRSHFTASHRAR